MNSLRSLIFVGACALGLLAGCGGQSDSAGSPPATSQSQPTAVQPPSSGQSSSSSSSSTSSSAPSGAATISGQPPSAATAGQAYSFTPTANAASGSVLTFSIANAPGWATFNTATGQLSGTPQAANIGTYSNIAISVTDGTSSASLPPFTITVNGAVPVSGTATLTWVPPTTNTDGTPITNLAGYRIYYGTNQNSLSQSVSINSIGVTSYVVQNLTSGTWYFAVKAYTTGGTESSLSNLVSKTIT